MRKLFLRNFPLFIIAIFVILIAILNYTAGAFLTGGDNLHPEFNFPLNIQRSIFSVWQEYQGLGLLGGMGHAADILRQLFLLPFSIILRTDQIRWFWTFLTLLVGTVGAYYLLLNFISRIRDEDVLKNKIIALCGGLFYLLNLSTVQSYFTPFEVFTAHFAFFPWMLLSTVNFFTKPNRKNLLLLALTLLIATPASYVPTLFLVYLMASFILAIFIIPGAKNILRTLFKFGFVAFLVNSFWLLPFIFFTLTNAGTNIDAKINQMATERIYLQNKEYGDLLNVSLLKGFWFKNVEPNLEGKFNYMLLPWKNHLDNPLIAVLGFAMFILIIIGIIFMIRRRSRIGYGMGALFLFSIMMLATATPPFSWINNFLRDHISIFNQIFRFPFTKFSILASLVYAFFFAIGIEYILTKLKRGLKTYLIALIILIIGLTVYCLPTFRGNFFYQRETIKIPNEYFQTFEFFKNQDPNTRIANFPQYTFWGWNFYNWGYSGSGFIWYGINQPILDRTFDVWSKDSENYYWEINHALYSKNPQLFESILNKYDVNWLLVDKNLTSPASPKSLFLNELSDLVGQIPSISKAATFGNIEIYRVALKNKPTSFVSSEVSLSSANPYAWGNYDQAYAQSGDYLSIKNQTYSDFFPFRSIFTGKSQKEINFKVTEHNSYLEFESPLPVFNNSVKLQIPSLVNKNNALPINIVEEKNGSSIKLSFEIQSPQVYLNENGNLRKIWESKIDKPLFENTTSNFPWKINTNGVSNFEIKDIQKKTIIGTTSLTTSEDNIIVLSDSKGKELDSVTIPGETLREWFLQDESFISLPSISNNTSIIVRVPKLNDNYSSFTIDPVQKVNSKEAQIVNCDNFRKDYFSYFIKTEEEKKLLELSSVNSTPCISFYLPTLDHDQGYFLTVKNQNIQGLPLHFWVLNEDEKTPLIDTYFEKNQKETSSIAILPPMEKFGKAYSIHFDNISIGKSEAGNLLGKIHITAIPYYFITDLKIQNDNQLPLALNKTELSVKHPNPSLYLVKTQPANNAEISLSQGYSSYWKAYGVGNFGLFNQIFPFFGTEIKNHVEIDNWKNGWIIDSSKIKDQTSIVIVYLPQYLEYIGFILTIGAIAVSIFLWLRRHRDLT